MQPAIQRRDAEGEDQQESLTTMESLKICMLCIYSSTPLNQEIPISAALQQGRRAN